MVRFVGLGVALLVAAGLSPLGAAEAGAQGCSERVWLQHCTDERVAQCANNPSLRTTQQIELCRQQAQISCINECVLRH